MAVVGKWVETCRNMHIFVTKIICSSLAFGLAEES